MSPLGIEAHVGSDMRQYLASTQAGDCEAVRASCFAIEAPELEGECVAEMTSRCGYQEREQVLVDCEALASPHWRGECFFNVVLSGLFPLDVDACRGLDVRAGTRCRRAAARELGVRLRSRKGTLDEKSSAEFCEKLQKANRQGAVDILGVHYRGNPDLEEELRSVQVETCGAPALPMTSPPARSPP